ncbi:aldehyde dehydrogenase family protein [Novosphingobium profundi]|uniref:aldehyde dehydrogenase family protein n=1 Tax=Novosphingobium profundi TaxID=1774954 RepID=UPI001FE4B7C9|nr:aldehyde dehydrogenase family protein [Novosphingobium profundi]MBT0670143.1 aldehyde dehydrogenase family protein [Novosphingobium profundi]
MNAETKIPTPATVDFAGPYRLSIAGKMIETNATFDVLNPATNEVFAQAPEGSAEQMEVAIAAAKAAFPAWAALSADERGAYVEAYADALEAHKDELITLLTREQGKPRHTMATGEVEAAIFWVREVAKRRLPVETLEDTEDHVVEVHHTPLGVVGAITPWNFPVLLGLWKVAPCLVTGNTMVMKPSPYTPLCTLRFGEIAQGVFPPGVLNIVSGGNALGAQMTEHPDIAKISFTGSTATGKKVMASGSSNLKRITLELGGNDAAIVLADADWQSIVPTLFWAAFGNSGQWCIASKRIYVHRSIHAEFVKAFVAFAKDMKVGDGMDPATDLGPIQNRMQYDKLKSLFADVKDKGYKVPLGGEIDESLAGNFVPVTIVDNPPEDSRIVQEEPFGPILPILAFDEVDEVVAKANASPFGLAGSVWGRDREAAIAVAKRLETGTVWVNEIHIHGIDIPFGGHKQSGMGVENGAEGLAEFTNTKTYMFHK